MKWFHHDCMAAQSAKLQTLIDTCGVESYGIYWMILETIGRQSDKLQLKICGVSGDPWSGFRSNAEDEGIPIFPVDALAYNFRTDKKRLLTVIEACVREGLFDRDKWLKSNILYSPGFERRADRYTQVKRARARRVQGERGKRRGTSTDVRTTFEECTNSVHTPSTASAKNVRLEQNRQEQNRKEENRLEQTRTEQQREEKKQLLRENRAAEEKLSTVVENGQMPDEENRKNFSDEGEFVKSASVILQTIQLWNEQGDTRCDWVPTADELWKLLYGGDPRRKEWLHYETMNLLGSEVTYTRIVQRAVLLMLEESRRRRITNPFGWVWTCLHGGRNGSPGWVHLLSASEEGLRRP